MQSDIRTAIDDEKQSANMLSETLAAAFDCASQYVRSQQTGYLQLSIGRRRRSLFSPFRIMAAFLLGSQRIRWWHICNGEHTSASRGRVGALDKASRRIRRAPWPSDSCTRNHASRGSVKSFACHSPTTTLQWLRAHPSKKKSRGFNVSVDLPPFNTLIT
jgi:hypothetical protein